MTALLVVGAIGLAFSPVVGNAWDSEPSLLRVSSRIPADVRAIGRPLVLTLGGPVYCGQASALAHYLKASLVCPDYGLDGERSGSSRARRIEDWGDPVYLAAVARLPEQLRRNGVKISELIFVGASYAGYAAAELVATHPQLHPRALIIVDSFLDLPSRFRALLPGQPTRAEMIRVLTGTLAQRPHLYEQRSPSNHLAGLAEAMRHGMRLIDVWSIAPLEQHEFNGGMCSARSNAVWLRHATAARVRPLGLVATTACPRHARARRGHAARHPDHLPRQAADPLGELLPPRRSVESNRTADPMTARRTTGQAARGEL